MEYDPSVPTKIQHKSPKAHHVQPSTTRYSPVHNVNFVQFDSPMVKTQNLKYKNQFPKIKELFFRLIFLYCLRMKTLKLVSLFFRALESLFLEYSKSFKMTRKSQIQSLKITVSSKIMFSFKPNKLGQIYVKWYIKTQILRQVSACLVAQTKYTLWNAAQKCSESVVNSVRVESNKSSVSIVTKRCTSFPDLQFLFKGGGVKPVLNKYRF